MRLATAAAAAALSLLPFSALADSDIESILGKPLIHCQGAIAWSPETEEARTRVEALQIAASTDQAASQISIYAAEKDFTHDDVLDCSNGICASLTRTATGTSSSVLHLVRGLDYGSGSIQYDLDAIFSIVSFADGNVVVEALVGRGGFICDDALPTAVALNE